MVADTGHPRCRLARGDQYPAHLGHPDPGQPAKMGVANRFNGIKEKQFPMDKLKVLLDTDIGSDIDDALALAYLLCQPRCDLLGVTTVTGEADKRAEMASAICRHVGRDDVPIHVGANQAMLAEIRQKTAQQAAALGDWPRDRSFPAGTAIEFMRRIIREHPGEVTLLAIGPMTNVGLLFATDPEIPGLLKQLVLMCGRFFDVMGGEWNAINDPHATAITYGVGLQSRPPRHVSYGLDVTLRCVMPAEECRKKFTAKVLQPVRDFAEVWFSSAHNIVFHDPLAAAGIFEPGLYTYREGQVAISLQPPTTGWTVFEDGLDRRHLCANTVDGDRFFAHYFDTVK